MKRIAVFASGSGSNAGALIKYFKAHKYLRVVLIICDKPAAGVYQIAADENVPLEYLPKEKRTGEILLELLKVYRIDFILLAGYLRLMPASVVRNYAGRILNIHPALLPEFGGKGMYGQHVHAAVLQAGKIETGITIHVVDEKYDEGKVIFQKSIPVNPRMTVQELQSAVNKIELENYPRVAAEYFDSYLRNHNNG
jgi:phosphoribosylglycinamide formyltransferase 1